MKCRNLHKTLLIIFIFEETHREQTLHIVNERSNVIRWKVALFRGNNTGIRINISFLSASTLLSVFSFVVSIYFFSKTERLSHRSISLGVLPSKFLPSARNPERKLKSDKTESRNFDFETKVRDKMPTERETYYLLLSRSIYRSEQTNLGDLRRSISALELFVRGNAETGLCRKGGGS